MNDELNPAQAASTPDMQSASPDMLPVSPDMAPPPDMLQQSLDMIQAGGPVVIILIAMSIIALTIILAKLWQFGSMRLGDTRKTELALRLWRTGRADEALAVAQRSANPAAQVIAIALRGMRRGLPEERIREEAMRHGEVLVESLRGWFRPLEVISSLAPLLGLFGTVQGMIAAFRQMEAAGNAVNPSVLSGGIWVALLTTAVGLAVAIPTVAALNWLERRTERTAHRIDIALSRVFSDELTDSHQEEASYAGHGFRPAVAPGE